MRKYFSCLHTGKWDHSSQFSAFDYTFIVLVHGRWSAWSKWSKCSVTCGGGYRQMTRSCDNPAPRNGGRPCRGKTVHRGRCGTRTCRSIYIFVPHFHFHYTNDLIFKYSRISKLRSSKFLKCS